jgi:NADH:ubiquinone oxidoreductase subunit E
MEQKPKVPKVYFCTNMRFSSSSPSCAMRGSKDVKALVEEELRNRGVSCDLEEFICLGQCTFGPAIKFIPGGEFFLHGTKDKVQEIADWVQTELNTHAATEEGG